MFRNEGKIKIRKPVWRVSVLRLRAVKIRLLICAKNRQSSVAGNAKFPGGHRDSLISAASNQVPYVPHAGNVRVSPLVIKEMK